MLKVSFPGRVCNPPERAEKIIIPASSAAAAISSLPRFPPKNSPHLSASFLWLFRRSTRRFAVVPRHILFAECICHRIQIVQHQSCTDCDTVQRVFGNMHRHAGCMMNQPVNSSNNAPPPVSVIPRSMISADRSGGVRSRV